MSHIGNIADLEDNASTSLTADFRQLLLVKRNGELFLYENSCPHTRETLDPMGGSVAGAGALLITCQRHAAEFLSDTGECVAGPCQGEFLTQVPFTLSNGDIYLD